jgi:hypothetical protein
MVGRRKHNNKPQHDETVDGLCITRPPPPTLGGLRLATSRNYDR